MHTIETQVKVTRNENDHASHDEAIKHTQKRRSDDAPATNLFISSCKKQIFKRPIIAKICYPGKDLAFTVNSSKRVLFSRALAVLADTLTASQRSDNCAQRKEKTRFEHADSFRRTIVE